MDRDELRAWFRRLWSEYLPRLLLHPLFVCAVGLGAGLYRPAWLFDHYWGVILAGLAAAGSTLLEMRSSTRLERAREKVFRTTGETLSNVRFNQIDNDSLIVKDFHFEHPLAPPPASDRLEATNVTAFAPPMVQRKEEFLVQLYFYSANFASLITEMAAEADPSASRRARAKVILPPDALVTVALSASGAEILEGPTSFRWDGEWATARFTLSIPGDFRGEGLICRALVSMDGTLATSLSFRLPVVDHPVLLKSRVARPVHFDRGFVSYASQDREEVAKRLQGIHATGLPFFFDRTGLRAGEVFDERLYAEINACDVFFLCWSRHAAASAWVKIETDYAVERQPTEENAAPSIIPILLPGAHADPPEALKKRKINFNSVYYDMILASQREAQLKNEPLPPLPGS